MIVFTHIVGDNLKNVSSKNSESKNDLSSIILNLQKLVRNFHR